MKMAEYIDRENYCENICKCAKEHCEKAKCPIWQAPAANVFEATPIDIDEYKFTHIRGNVRVKTQTLEDYYKFKRDVKAEGIKEFVKKLKDTIMGDTTQFYIQSNYAQFMAHCFALCRIEQLEREFERGRGNNEKNHI